jgi:ABC-type bacteriocin/lantibiotic exporter with double-glycine peptidase domain
MLVSILGLAPPYFIKLLIDEVYPSRDVSLMYALVTGALAIGIAMATISAMQNYLNLIVNSRLNNLTTLLFFNHMQHLPLRFFGQNRVGELMSRYGDVRLAVQAVAKVIATVLGQGIFVIIIPPLLFLIDWRLALPALIGVPITIAIALVSGSSVRKRWKLAAESYADVTALQVETLSNINAVKSSVLERHIFLRCSNLMLTAMRLEIRAGALAQVLTLSNGVLITTNTALLAFIGWRLILSGSIGLGDYIAFMAYVGFVYGPVYKLVDLLSEFQQAAVSFHRMFEYLDTPAEQDPRSAYEVRVPHHKLAGHIEFRHVNFSYAADRTTLEDVTLTIRPGTILSIVGPSGSGKSTLLKLLTRLERHQQGKIIIDGVPIDRIELGALRRQIAVVWQDLGLWTGSIWDNLVLGVENVDSNAVYRATRLAQADDFIQELPLGYSTPVAEAGTSLSMGQRQRLAIAHALIRDAPIILLDEATSNIDLHAESQILEALFPALQDKTVVYVTHRLNTAKLADAICVLQDGRVVGQGTHEDLLSSCDFYREMSSDPLAARNKNSDTIPKLVVLPAGTSGRV